MMEKDPLVFEQTNKKILVQLVVKLQIGATNICMIGVDLLYYLFNKDI